MNLGLQNKIAVITREAKEIGTATALGSGNEGGPLVNIDCDEAATESSRNDFNQLNTPCNIFVIDLSEPSIFLDVIEAIVTKFGCLEALVINAEINYGVEFKYGTHALFFTFFRFNLLHYYATACAVLQYLARTNRATSTFRRVWRFQDKWILRLRCVTEHSPGVCNELGREVVTLCNSSNAVIPAVVATPQFEESSSTGRNSDDFLRAAPNAPLEHLYTEVDKVASTAQLLLSPATNVRGQFAYVHGGYGRIDRNQT